MSDFIRAVIIALALATVVPTAIAAPEDTAPTQVHAVQQDWANG